MSMEQWALEMTRKGDSLPEQYKGGTNSGGTDHGPLRVTNRSRENLEPTEASETTISPSPYSHFKLHPASFTTPHSSRSSTSSSHYLVTGQAIHGFTSMLMEEPKLHKAQPKVCTPATRPTACKVVQPLPDPSRSTRRQDEPRCLHVDATHKHKHGVYTLATPSTS